MKAHSPVKSKSVSVSLYCLQLLYWFVRIDGTKNYKSVP